MTLLEVLDYLSKYQGSAQESGVLLERLSPILLSRPYLLERAIVGAWPFFEHLITQVCTEHAHEIAHIDAVIAKSEGEGD